MIQTWKLLRVFVKVWSFACLFKESEIFIVQQIEFSSKKNYNWIKKECHWTKGDNMRAFDYIRLAEKTWDMDILRNCRKIKCTI